MQKRNMIIALLLLMPFMAGAQALKGSYFVDNSLNRHELNPAFAPRSNYVQLLGIGNVSVGAYSNLDIPTFLYPTDDGLKTFLHNDISVKQFARKLPNHPNLDMETELTLLGFGFRTKKNSYWTFDLGMKAMADVDLPRDLFMFVKKGTGASGESFNIGNVNAYASASVQAAIGYSRDLFEGLRVGAKVKLIAPVAYASINLEHVSLTTASDKWSLNTEGYMNVAVQGLEMDKADGEMVPEVGFDLGKTLSNGALAGFGWAIDLGAEYQLNIGSILDGMRFSAAVTDLGAIHYSRNAMSSFKTSGSLDWAGFQNISLDNMDFYESVDEFWDEAQNLFVLSEDRNASLAGSTMPRYYLGVEMPFLNDMMSAGLLYSGRIGKHYVRQELTASYNLTPCKWFSLGLNYSFLNTARTIGWVLEFTPKFGPMFYIGGDYMPLSFASVPMLEDYGVDGVIVPMSMRLNLNMGIALALGTTKTK